MRLVLLIVLSCVVSSVGLAGNFILSIDGENYDVSLGKDETIKIGDKELIVKIEQKETLTYQSDFFSFDHSNKHAPSKSTLDAGLFQTAMITPLGALVLVQEYSTLNPSSLVGLMINEVTKEEKQYGYEITEEASERTLADGTVLKGKVVFSKYKGSDIKRYLYTYGKKDAGILVMTQIDYELAKEDEAMINQFFKTLNVDIQ
ncbi:MAG: hypothetical protein ACRBEE_05365 [Arenicella sp.]